MKNRIGLELRELQLVEYLSFFDNRTHEMILRQLQRPDVEGAVMFENEGRTGTRSSLIYGPGCTYHTLAELAEGHLGDGPDYRWAVAYTKKYSPKT